MSTRPGHQVTQILLLLWVTQAMQPVMAENVAEHGSPLTARIDYRFLGHLGQTNDDGRLLVWEASAEGDLQGKMKWWFMNPPPVAEVAYTNGHVSFYAARWELWVDDELLLAGETTGKTDFRDGADGMWDGHGRITEAHGRFAALEGHEVYESGPVILGEDPPRSLSGTGLFTIY